MAPPEGWKVLPDGSLEYWAGGSVVAFVEPQVWGLYWYVIIGLERQWPYTGISRTWGQDRRFRKLDMAKRWCELKLVERGLRDG